MRLCASSTVRGACFSRQEDNGIARAGRGNSGDDNSGSPVGRKKSRRPVKQKGWGHVSLRQGCLHSCSIVSSFTKGDSWGLLTQPRPTQDWQGCCALIIFFWLVTLGQWTELELGLQRDLDLYLLLLLIVETFQLINVYRVPMTCQIFILDLDSVDISEKPQRFRAKRNTQLSLWPSNPTPKKRKSGSQKDLHTNGHSRFIHSSPKLVTT